MQQTPETSSVTTQRSSEATKTIPSTESKKKTLEGRQRTSEHPLIRREDTTNPKINNMARADATRREAGVNEVRTSLRQEEQEKYTKLLRNEFLTPDGEGRCSAESGNYQEAFRNLLQRAGDPNQWRPEDMTKPAVIAATNCYRAFGELHEGRSLTFEQIGALRQLHTEQQQINEQRIQKATSTYASKDAILDQRQQLEQVKQALENYQPVKENTNGSLATPSNPNGTIPWATPEYMGPQLTHSIWELYKASLRMSDSARASIRVPNKAVNEALQGNGDKETLLSVIAEMLLAIAQSVTKTSSAEPVEAAA